MKITVIRKLGKKLTISKTGTASKNALYFPFNFYSFKKRKNKGISLM